MSISTPCEHSGHPPTGNFVRGQYESVEFIREVPRSKKAASTTELTGSSRSGPSEKAIEDLELDSADAPTSPGRPRGRTIGFAESRGFEAKGETIDLKADDEDEGFLPVEWIMITRSDPGGSVPRFLVERGTPGGITSDASKFLDWASKREHTLSVNAEEQQDDLLVETSSDTPTGEVAGL